MFITVIGTLDNDSESMHVYNRDRNLDVVLDVVNERILAKVCLDHFAGRL